MLFISKQLTAQKYIFKIHSERLRKEGWGLSLSLPEARKNDELISLADSQVLRWVDELNGRFGIDDKVLDIKSEIRRIHREPNSAHNRKYLRELYAELDQLQFKPDYMCLIIDREKDYYKACKGFTINGIKYCRLLGTNGGIKNSTIVFVSERLSAELKRRIENGRDMSKPLVTAKLEAYKALACSASIPVSLPKGVLVVNDCETTFKSDVIYISDEQDGEPIMEERKAQEIVLNASDGYGIMLPSLAERWSKELKLDYVVSGVNTRFAFEKGMVFTFDFIDFADKVSGKYIVKDAWGNDYDIRNAELILTTSMVKLWDSYKDCNDYVGKSIANGFTFAVTKTCPQKLESERTLNYQFIQSFDLDDNAVDKLISPTIKEFKEVLEDNPVKSVLFLKGSGLNERNVRYLEDDMSKAIMIDRRMAADTYIQKSVYRLIKNKIDKAKIGVIKVHGNYSIVSGDPYALCQSVFGLEVTGLLKAGEIYNKYWVDVGSSRLICFRAPMTCHNNVLSTGVSRSEEAAYWYQYMKTCTVFNCWDTAMCALNGMDFDGDLVMLTDNSVLLENHQHLPSLMCVQRKAEKAVSTEDDFVRSNIDSFGNDIGKITNRITSMYDVRSKYAVGSKEYEVLSYRIRCGQLFQQNAIDKAKGIICKPMPRTWHDKHSVGSIEKQEDKDFGYSVIADKKPYFMRYIYPALMKQYNEYIKNVNCNSLRQFQMTLSELKSLPSDSLNEQQANFLKFFDLKMPVGVGDCIVNKICRRFEEEFDGFVSKCDDSDFDYTIMKSGVYYTNAQFYAIKKLHEEYGRRLRNLKIYASNERLEDVALEERTDSLKAEFLRRCGSVCSNKETLCDIILDLCYKRDLTKKFAWDMCREQIIENLLKKSNYTLSYPELSENGNIYYQGKFYELKEVVIDNEHCIE